MIYKDLISAWNLMRAAIGQSRRFASGILVYALLFGLLVGGVVLPPMLSLLDLLGQYGGDVIVGNYSILPWILSGRGIAWGILLLFSSLFLLVLFTAGLFLLFALRVEADASRRAYLLALWKRLPEILLISGRWSLFFLGAVAILGVVPGLGFLVFLREHDINYYLKSMPAEWLGVIGGSVLWVACTGFLFLRGLLRVSLLFPLWVRGHGNLRESAYESWTRTRGHERRLGLLVVMVVGLASLFHIIFNLSVFHVMDTLLPVESDSLKGTLGVIAGGILLLIFEAFVIFCLVIAWLCAIWSRLCEELCASPTQEPRTVSAQKSNESRIFLYLIITIACVMLIALVFHKVLRLPQHSTQSRALVIAHRGGAGEAPENSLEAYGLALSKGYSDMVEMDVAMTSDNVLILAHDSDLMRQAGEPRKLCEVSWAEMSKLTLKTPQSKGHQFAPMSLFEDVLRLIGRRCPMIVEFKHSKRTPDLISRTVAEVKKQGLMDRVVFMSLDMSDIREVQDLAPEAKVGYFVSVEMGDFMDLKIDYLAPRHTLIKRKIVIASQERGIPVVAWTVDDPVRIVELLDLGVDAIITNEPSRVRRVVDAYFMIPAQARSLLRFRRLWSLFSDRQEFKALIDSASENNAP